MSAAPARPISPAEGRAARIAVGPSRRGVAAPEPEPELDWGRARRLGGLRRFAAAITLLNVLGHAFLGFETSWAHPFAAALTAYALEWLLEWIDARATDRVPRFREGGRFGWVDFLLSAHISAMAVSMLLYPGERLWPVMFATAVAVGSKVVLRLEVDGRSRHVMNPSNLGIAVTLLLFPSVGIAPPYQFTEFFLGVGNWIFPGILIGLGTMINARYTRRLPLIAAWLGGFVLQAVVRSALGETALVPSLVPMTGLAFLLFTFYMVTDPPTTPSSRRGQLAFGLSVAGAYGLLMAFHVVFGLFFALVVVCGARGAWLAWRAGVASLVTSPTRASAPVRG